MPVVPLEPSSFRVEMRCSTSSRSSSRSFIHREARLPTVTSWAAWKWVKPRVGRALYSRANLARASSTCTSLFRTRISPSRMRITSVLSPT